MLLDLLDVLRCVTESGTVLEETTRESVPCVEMTSSSVETGSASTEDESAMVGETAGTAVTNMRDVVSRDSVNNPGACAKVTVCVVFL